MEEILFPYDEIRNIQDQMIKEIEDCLKLQKNIIVHAPTGLGKTAASLPSALSYAIKHDLTVFFLTSRHTQHMIAIDTLKQIKKKHNIKIPAVDLIGKQWMCPVPGTDSLYHSEFSEYCKQQREDNKCEFYTKTKSKSLKPTTKAKKVLEELKLLSPSTSEDLIEICTENKLCPYEMAGLLAKDAKVIVADYYLIFHDSIRNNFFTKAEIDLKKSIVIIDEAHNLPKRTRELMTARLTNFTISNAIKEARKFHYEDTEEYLLALKDIFKNYLTKLQTIEEAQRERVDEVLLDKEDFISKIKLVEDYDELITHLHFIADEIREKNKRSYIGAIATFLESWLGPE